MSRSRLSRFSLLLGALAASPAGPAAAETFRGDYSVSLWGLTIGRSSFTTSIEGDRISVDGTVNSAGLARVFDSTKGQVSVSGRVGRNAVTPTRYRMNYTSGKKSKATTIEFSGGAVTGTQITPKPRSRDKDDNWVKLDRRDLGRVADPLTGIFVKASSPADVCGQTLRFYDGEGRTDLVLSPAGASTVSVEGREIEAVNCRATYKARSGYKTTDSTVRHLERKGNIRIAFAELGQSGVFAPVEVKVDTTLGTVTLSADRYGPL